MVYMVVLLEVMEQIMIVVTILLVEAEVLLVQVAVVPMDACMLTRACDARILPAPLPSCRATSSHCTVAMRCGTRDLDAPVAVAARTRSCISVAANHPLPSASRLLNCA